MNPRSYVETARKAVVSDPRDSVDYCVSYVDQSDTFYEVMLGAVSFLRTDQVQLGPGLLRLVGLDKKSYQKVLSRAAGILATGEIQYEYWEERPCRA